MENNSDSKAVLMLRSKILDRFKELQNKYDKSDYPEKERRKIRVEISRMAECVVNKRDFDDIFEEFGEESRLGKFKINSADKTIKTVRAEARKILKDIYENITVWQYSTEDFDKIMTELLRIDTIISKRQEIIKQKSLEEHFNLDR